MAWPTKNLEETCNIVYGFAFKASTFNEIGKGLPVIRIGDVDKRRTNKFFDGKYDKKYIIKKDDILLGLSGSFKAFRWEGGAALLNQRVATLRNFKNKIIESFVFYQMPRLFLQFEKTITQLSVKNILSKHLENLKIFYPPLKIQKQIVERLDKIAEAQKLNDNLIQKADEFFQSLLHRELNTVSKGWEVKKLGSVFVRINDSILPTKHLEQKFNFIGLENIESNTSRLVNLSPTEGKFIKSTKTRFKIGDVLYGKLRPYLNKVWLADTDGICSTDIWVLRAKHEVLLSQLLWAILKQSVIVQRSSASMAGANLPRANKDVFDNIKIVLPPLKIQKQIVAKLSAVQEYKKHLLEQKLKLKELFDSVLSKSMSGELIK